MNKLLYINTTYSIVVLDKNLKEAYTPGYIYHPTFGEILNGISDPVTLVESLDHMQLLAPETYYAFKLQVESVTYKPRDK